MSYQFFRQTYIYLIYYIVNNFNLIHDYFCTTFCSDLMCNNDIKGLKFVWVLVVTKSDQKVILCTKNLLKSGFSLRNIFLQFVSVVFGL